MSQISESDKSGEKEANDEKKPFAVETRQTGGGKNTDLHQHHYDAWWWPHQAVGETCNPGGNSVKICNILKLEQPQTGAVAVQT